MSGAKRLNQSLAALRAVADSCGLENHVLDAVSGPPTRCILLRNYFRHFFSSTEILVLSFTPSLFFYRYLSQLALSCLVPFRLIASCDGNSLISRVIRNCYFISRRNKLTVSYLGWLSTEYGTRSRRCTIPNARNMQTRSPALTSPHISATLHALSIRFYQIASLTPSAYLSWQRDAAV